MTPQLQMAIKLLQLNRLELMDMIQQELEVNPTLEEFQDPSVDDASDQTIETPPVETDTPSTKRSKTGFLRTKTNIPSDISVPWRETSTVF